MNFLLIIIIIGIFITGSIMVMGVMAMSQGGDFNKRNGNKLMRARIISQFVTLALVVLYLYLYT